jgi:hypothetical protein
MDNRKCKQAQMLKYYIFLERSFCAYRLAPILLYATR